MQNGASPFRLLRDLRVIQAAGQIFFALILITLLVLLFSSISDALRTQNLTPNFGYLQNRAGFDIGENPGWYTSDNTFFDAFVVGLINTLRVIVVGLVASTLLGIFGGIFLLSTNWLLRTITRVYVEILRNTPLLVQLIVWYFIVMFSLPVVQQSITFPAEGVTFIALRLLAYPLVVVLLRSWSRGRLKLPVAVMGAAAAAFMVEGGLWLAGRSASWASVPGKAAFGDGAFLLYLLVSVTLVALAVRLPREMRPSALSITLGQWIGGLLLYFGLVPNAALRVEIYPAIYINNRGFLFPEVLTTNRFNEWMLFVVVGVVLAAVQWAYFRRVVEQTGRRIPFVRNALLLVVGFALLGWVLVQLEPSPPVVPVAQDGQVAFLTVEEARAAELFPVEVEALYTRSPLLFVLPQRTGFNFSTGNRVSPEYMALLLGLTIYTSAFIAEIVRAGIQAVPYGQVEAARSIGLSYVRVLRLIVLPQALRVIIPPLGNQYLNLSKNSSLAVAIAYADLFQVTTTIMNTSGQSVPGILMVMLTYLVLSLLISLGTNWFNRRLRYVSN